MKNPHPVKLAALTLFAAAILLPAASTQAQSTIVDYQFVTASPDATTGSSISSLTGVGGLSVGGYNNWATGTETGTQRIFFNGASGAGRSIDISLDATGLEDITLGSFFQLTSQNNLSAVNWRLSYSTNGGTSFTQIGSDFSIILTGGGNSENARITEGASFNLGGAADNNPNIVFRLNSAPSSLDFDGNTALGGQVAFDNFSVLGTAIIPEPSSFALLSGILALGWIMVRRR